MNVKVFSINYDCDQKKSHAICHACTADSLSFPLVILLCSNLAHAILVDEDAGEAAGEHDSEQLDHGQDRAGDGEYRQDRDDVVLEIFWRYSILS